MHTEKVHRSAVQLVLLVTKNSAVHAGDGGQKVPIGQLEVEQLRQACSRQSPLALSPTAQTQAFILQDGGFAAGAAAAASARWCAVVAVQWSAAEPITDGARHLPA